MTTATFTHSRNSTPIELSGLRKRFGDVEAVAGLNLVVAPGEVVALLGPNGAGKTTTIEMLLGLQRPDEGGVAIFGMDPVTAIRRGVVGAMLQSGGLVPDLTVKEVLALVASFHDKPLPTDRALALASIEDLADRRIAGLSGGQRQRVLFALAVIPDPDLVVLDEPTVAMDVESRRAFWSSMRELARTGRSVLFATHYLEEADQNADRIVLMARGSVVADGSASSIKAAVAVRRIRCTLPGAQQERLATLPGVRGVEIHGEDVVLACADADAALRALLEREPQARDLEVRGADLEEAFLALTA